MATTFEDYNAPATYSFTFPSYQSSDVKVRVDGVLKTAGTHYNINSYSTTGGGTVVFIDNSGSGGTNHTPSSPSKVRVYRDTNVDVAKATYTAGSSVKAADLNNNNTQLLYRAQEEQVPNLIQSYDIEPSAIETANLKNDSVTSDKIADDQINSEHYAAGSIDLEHMSANSVDSDQYVDGSIDRVHLEADIIDSTKLADDSVNSEHYVDLSIDTQHIANLNVTTAKIDNLAVTTGKIADLNVTRGKLEADAVDGTKLADNAVNTEHYTDNSIQHVHLQNDIIDGDNIVDDAINVEHITNDAVRTNQIQDGAITSAKLSDATVITSSEQSSATTNDTSFLTSAAADARFFNISSGDTIKDGDTFPDNDTTIATTAAINDRIIDLVDDVGGFVPIANETSFPTANPDVNDGTGTIVSVSAASTNLVPSGTTVTIANGAGTGNTVTITGVSSTIPSGFGFLVETTTTLHTYTFHRLSPKATEVTTVAGISTDVTTVSTNNANVSTVAGIDSDVTTVAGIASNVTAVANNTTNINAVQANETNINAVKNNETNINTVATANTAVNTVSNNITSVNTAANNLTAINKFGDTYQIASSNPSTDGGGNAVAEGDLYFNTSANRLKVYDGANWVDGVIASGGGAQTTGDTFTGDLKLNDNVKLLVGTGSDLEIFHHASNGSFINDAGTSTLKLQTGGATKLEIVSTGVSVTGNITISGTVDGRDVAADGTSLDNFEAGNVTTNVTNGNIKLTPDGTGVAEVRGAGGNDGTLQLNCSANSHGVKIKSPPHSAGASYTLTLPNTDGNNNQVLKTDGSGNLDWVDVGTAFLADDAVTTVKIADDAVDGTKLANPISLPDDHKISFGTGSDNNLEIFHESSSNTNEIIAADGAIEIKADNFMLVSDDTGGRAIYLNNNGGHLELGFDGNHDARFAGNQVTFLTNVDANAGLDVTGNITVSGTVDGIDIATDVAANTAKVTNATHTGDVTGATVLTIANDAVTNAKIANGAVDSEHLATGILNNSNLFSGAIVNTAQIVNNAVTENEIADDAVTTNKIATDAVTEAKLSHTGVSAGTYGSATAIPVITVSTQGRISSATTATINSDVISTQQAAFNNRTLATGFNHIMAGPVTIASGQAITLDGTAKLTIIG